MKRSLKIDSIQFKNHVHLKTIQCEFDGTITEIIGLNGSGKTTIINALWMAVKGIALKGNDCIIGDRFKFIQSGKKSMDVEIALIDENHNNAKILLKRHTLKSSSKLTFKAPENYPISHEWLQNLLSVSFLSAKNFTQKNKKEQALLLGIDTSKFDEELNEVKGLYTLLNRQYKAIGEPEPVEKVEQVDVQELLKRKAELQKEIDERFKQNSLNNHSLRQDYDQKVKSSIKEAEIYNIKQDENERKIDVAKSLHKQLIDLGYNGRDVIDWIKSLPQPETYKDITGSDVPHPDYIEEIPDKTAIEEIDKQIAEASDVNHKAVSYQNYLKIIQERDAKKKELEENQIKQKEIKQRRLEYIQSYNLAFDGLEIDEEGGLILHGREIREPYFSKGELEKIVAMLRASLDDALKVVFIDDFDLLDEKNQKEIPEYLIEKEFQVIVAKVGQSKGGKNIISLSEPIEENNETKPSLI
jgi:recombinational DNA repair ATPase RecF